jgi:hypothetical protein
LELLVTNIFFQWYGEYVPVVNINNSGMLLIFIRDEYSLPSLPKNLRIKIFPLDKSQRALWHRVRCGKYFRATKMDLLRKEQGRFMIANIIFAPHSVPTFPEKNLSFSGRRPCGGQGLRTIPKGPGKLPHSVPKGKFSWENILSAIFLGFTVPY